MKTIFIFLFSFWILLSFFTVFYNMKKMFSEIREWSYLSDTQKRNKIFGDSHDFFILIKEHTKKTDHILIFSKDGKTYFLSIYYLYPRVITSTFDEKQFTKLVTTKQFTYIAAYDLSIVSDHYEKIASFSSKTSTNYGSLFKLK